MKNLLRACLLACAFAASSSAAVYDGPDDTPTRSYTTGTCGALPSALTNQTYSQFLTAAGTCSLTSVFKLNTVANGSGTGCPGTTTYSDTGATLFNPQFLCGSAGASWGKVDLLCGANRATAQISGATRCVSTCYALIDTVVSAFVPIEDPAQSVIEACFQTTSNGLCEIAASETSNYTYGGQLYRAGTFVHVGKRCTEDTSSPPVVGATGGPTASVSGPSGTGSGSGGGLSAGDSANLNATRVGVQSIDAVMGAARGELANIKAGQCGAPGQPVCSVSVTGQVALDEAGVAAQTTTMTAGIAAAQTTMTDRVQETTDSIKPDTCLDCSSADNGGTFAPSGGRWNLSFDAFLPAAECAIEIPFGKFGVENFNLSVCDWGEYVRNMLGWMMAAITMVSLWNNIFKPGN